VRLDTGVAAHRDLTVWLHCRRKPRGESTMAPCRRRPRPRHQTGRAMRRL